MFKDRPEEISLRDMENRVALHYAAEIPNTNLFVKLLDADSSLIDSQVPWLENVFEQTLPGRYRVHSFVRRRDFWQS